MDITCISDLHGFYPKLDGGDLLIVAGDLTATDSVLDHMRFQMWLHEQDYKKRIIIAGNHDVRLQQLPFESIKRQYAETGEDYLCDSGTQFEGLKIWGSPWTQTFPGMNPHCMAFTKPPGQLKEHWEMIPDDVDILITHGPAHGILDHCFDRMTGAVRHVGCRDLMFRMHDLPQCRLHVFGHIHEGHGVKVIENVDKGHAPFYRVNASLMNEDYEFVNKPIRIIL